MKRNTTIALFYTGVAAICIGVISISMYLSKGLNAPYQAPLAVNTGKDTAPQWFEIAKDLPATNQDNKPVKLSDLRGKVWIVAEFFAICPHCAVRNGEELRKIYDEFKGDPDFHMTCISVDP
ncbi:MAG: SCO family protein, partial [Luteolibacter sp.]